MKEADEPIWNGLEAVIMTKYRSSTKKIDG